MNHHGRWRIGALASAIALLGSMASLQAHAVALGRITVQSALGESLRAEIDISDLSAEEAASLKIGVAGADAFKSAGLEYPAAAAGLDVRLQRRADGRPYLRLSSNRAVTDPFVDLILEARWSAGRVTRDYTLLFDPPSPRAGSAAASSAPLLPRQEFASSVAPARQEAPARARAPDARPAPRPAARAPVPRLAPAESIPGATQVTVRPGDNASRIAARNKPANVSLDQMLVALLRGNPQAFVDGNINVIKSGAVVDIPDEQAARALSPSQARQTLIAQSGDFNTFRRKLAEGAPAAPTASVDTADRQAGGKLQARVDDGAPASASPDKLTLSKGAVQARPADAPAASTGGSNPPGTAPVANTAAPGLVLPVPAPGIAVATATPAPSPDSAEPGASLPPAEPAPTPSAPVAPPAAVVISKPALVVPPPPATPEPGLVDLLLDNSLLLGGGLLLALLAGLGFSRYRKAAKTANAESSFLDSRLQPDSFFGASGGRRVDTNAGTASGSSADYSPSQLDAAGDVDPVAEADVYLAYGRDQQAEEILKEALRTYPERLAIHTKLLEIFAKRRDHKAFESLALTAFALSKGQGPEWSYISQLGRELEPSNPAYQSGAGAPGSTKPRSDFAPLGALSAQTPTPKPATAPAPAVDLDLDLDFSLDEAAPAPSASSASLAPSARPALSDPTATTVPAYLRAIAPTSTSGAMPSALMNLDGLDLDLNLDDLPAAAPALAKPVKPVERPAPQPAKAAPPEIDFLANGLDFTPEPYRPPAKAPRAAPAPLARDGMLEFDLNVLSLDLPYAARPPASSSLGGLEEDPLEVKFLLAEEFRLLGDSEGARSLADEVLAQAKGPLKSKAQAFVNNLS